MTQDSWFFSSSSEDVLRAPTRYTLLALPGFIREVQAWCSQAGSRVLTLDLSQMADFEIPAFRSLVWARRQLKTLGRELVLIMPPGGVFTAHEEAIMRDLFAIQENAPTSDVA